MKKTLLFLIVIFLLICSGCSNTPTEKLSESTNNPTDNNSSSLEKNPATQNEVSSIDETNASSNIESQTEISIFKKKNISKIEILEKEYKNENGKKVYTDKFIVKSTVNDSEKINQMSEFLFSDAVEESSTNWAKLNPAHANYRAINVFCDDNTCYIINLHFSENSETKYIAVALADFDTEYNTFVNKEDAEDNFKKCIISKSFSEFIVNLF